MAQHPKRPTPNLTAEEDPEAEAEEDEEEEEEELEQEQELRQRQRLQARLREDTLDPNSGWRYLDSIHNFSPVAKRQVLERHEPGAWTIDFYRNRSNESEVRALVRLQGSSVPILLVGFSKQGKSSLINSFNTAKDYGRPYHKAATVGNIKGAATTQKRLHYPLRFDKFELDLGDTRGFISTEHWRDELLRLVRAQRLSRRRGDPLFCWARVRNILQDSIKPRRARVVFLVLRGDKIDSYADDYREMGEALNGVVPYLFVVTYTRLPEDIDDQVAKLAKKLGARSKDMVFPIEIYTDDDRRPNEKRNGRILSLLLQAIVEAETQGVGLYDTDFRTGLSGVLIAVALLIVILSMFLH